MQTLYLIILAILGWGLTVYFGFFRLRQYQWTRLKVESDLFLKLNQRGGQLFLKLSNLSILSQKNDRLNVKYLTVKQAYIQLWREKIFLFNRGVVPKEVYTFWIWAIQILP